MTTPSPDPPPPATRGSLSVATGVLIVLVMVAGAVRLATNGLSSDTPRPATGPTTTTTSMGPAVVPVSYPGMPPVVDPANIYGEVRPDRVSPAVAGDAARVYVPNGRSGTVTVIDPASRTAVDSFRTPGEPQHVVPSYDLRTLWVLENQGNAVVPIDPATGTPGEPVPVEDPYNLYFTPDGGSAIVVAEARQRLDFRDPHTMELTSSLDVTGCAGINHADYDSLGAYLVASCEYTGKLVKIDIAQRAVLGFLDLAAQPVDGQPVPPPHDMPDGSVTSSMPQDVRAGPDGRHFYVADMMAGGVFVVDGATFTVDRFIPTGIGTHGITPARDGKTLYVANRGSDMITGSPHGPGSVSVLDVPAGAVTATWRVPDGGSPDMGNLNVAGTELWLAGRFDSEVYVFDTVAGGLVARIAVDAGPHGLAVWPQPGRYSLGHTGNMR